MHADDTSCIIYAAKDVDDLTNINTMHDELMHLKEWLQGNKLFLNVVKTQCMIIG